MPRSRRAYGDPLPTTLANAIAFAHMTQSMRGLHMSTRSKLMDLYDFADRAPHYRFNEEAMKLAEKSVYWTGYQWLTAKGCRIKMMTRHCMRMIDFWGPADEEGTEASLDRAGEVFIYPSSGLWKDRTRRLTVEQMRAELDALQGACT